MANTTTYHTTVLLKEAVDALNIKSDGVYVDCTLGGGGHSKEILKRLGNKGRLIAFDQDKDAWANLPKDERVYLVKENFRYLKRFLKLLDFPTVDGILADLGVSSFHFDTAERGFSIRFDAPLDMRMDSRSAVKASDIISNYSEDKLQDIFERYGEVRNAKTLAKTIVQGRASKGINTISDFKSLIEPMIKGNPNRYLAQVFQALRIEVNEELVVLKEFLKQTPDCLKPEGRLAIITFHSLEDRIVKQYLKKGGWDKIETDLFGVPRVKSEFLLLGDVVPSQEEIETNPRSRSARLRIGERK